MYEKPDSELFFSQSRGLILPQALDGKYNFCNDLNDVLRLRNINPELRSQRDFFRGSASPVKHTVHSV